MSNLSTLPNGDSAWLLRKAIERVMQQVSVLETNIGSSTTGNSANTQIIFNDNGVLRGDPDLIFNTALNKLVATALESTTSLVVGTSATITGALTVDTTTLKVDATNHRVGIGTASPLNAVQIQGAGQATVTPTVTGDGSALSLIDSLTVANNGGMLVLGSICSNGNFGQVGIKSLLTNGLQNGTSALGFFTRAAVGDTTLGERYRIAQDGVATWSNVGGVAGTAMTLNSTGLGVGVASPAYKLDVSGTGNFQQLRVSNAVATNIGLVNTTSGLTYALYSANTSSNGFNGFGIFDGSAYVLRINSTGNLLLAGGTAGATGVGVTFPATQVASSDANTLDDYEEGTWTPTIVGTTTAGVGVYSLQAGLYTKIGNRVFVEGYISWSAHTGTGNMRIGGLPFTINSSSFYSSGSIGDTSGIALTAGNILAIIGVATSATIDFKQLPTGGGSSAAVPIDTAANVSFSLCYIV
jgi:hypothetical protein